MKLKKSLSLDTIRTGSFWPNSWVFLTNSPMTSSASAPFACYTIRKDSCNSSRTILMRLKNLLNQWRLITGFLSCCFVLRKPYLSPRRWITGNDGLTILFTKLDVVTTDWLRIMCRIKPSSISSGRSWRRLRQLQFHCNQLWSCNYYTLFKDSVNRVFWAYFIGVSWLSWAKSGIGNPRKNPSFNLLLGFRYEHSDLLEQRWRISLLKFELQQCQYIFQFIIGTPILSPVRLCQISFLLALDLATLHCPEELLPHTAYHRSGW